MVNQYLVKVGRLTYVLMVAVVAVVVVVDLDFWKCAFEPS